MGKLVVSENVTLNGVVQDPAGDEGFRLGGWVGLIKDRPGVNQLALDDALGAEALLLGRRSYEWFAERWPARTGELADRLNSLPKYVVSSTLEDADWNNSTVLKGDAVGEVAKGHALHVVKDVISFVQRDSFVDCLDGLLKLMQPHRVVAAQVSPVVR